MLASLIKHLLHPSEGPAALSEPRPMPLRLHIGGQEPHRDWKIVNVRPGAHTDYVRSCTDLSPFANDSVEEIYASHVIEHLGYHRDLPAALTEFRRVLVPGGTLKVSVPDLAKLCALFIVPDLSSKEREWLMRVMYGGQTDANDFHYVGLYEELMFRFLKNTGFVDVRRVDLFGLFADTSSLIFRGHAISLNVIARKPSLRGNGNHAPAGG